MGGQGLGQRQRRRERARAPVRRHPPLRRAHGRRDDPPHLPLARGRVRRGPADHEHRQHARDLHRVPGQPRRRRIRHLGRQVPLLAEEPAAGPGQHRDRHRPEPELRLQVGPRRSDQREPAGDHLPRAAALLRARDARDARLPGQPGRRRPAADPGRDLVPRARPAGHVAVRLHAQGHPAGHDHRGPFGAVPDRTAHGHDERLSARAGERPVHHPGHDQGLHVRDVPDLRLHVRDVDQGLPRRLEDRRRDRVATRRPCST